MLDLDCHAELPEEWRLPGLRDGRDVLAQLCHWAGQPWPSTYTVLTPSGGWHLYYRAPDGVTIRNSASQLGPQIDVRGSGGYVVGAGSVIGGRAYTALADDAVEPLPAWLCRMLTRPRDAPRSAPGSAPAGARLRGLVSTVAAGKPGDRTGPLVWAAHRLAEMIQAREASPDDAEQLVAAAVAAGISGGERYARYQVRHILQEAR